MHFVAFTWKRIVFYGKHALGSAWKSWIIVLGENPENHRFVFPTKKDVHISWESIVFFGKYHSKQFIIDKIFLHLYEKFYYYLYCNILSFF